MIPPELTTLDRWVCASDKSKTPMRAFEWKAASTTDPDSWADYACARQTVKNGVYDYVGFVFAGDGYVGIDLDRGYDSDGFITPEAAEVIKRFSSYTEESRSGRGFHIITKGTLPFTGRNNRRGMEVYASGRYFILTGKTVVFADIRENQPALDWLIETHFADCLRETDSPTRAPRQYSPVWHMPPDGKLPLRPDYPPVGEGSRNMSLLSLGGMLRETGYDKTQVYAELLRMNARACEPPLSEYEVRQVCDSVMRYQG